MTNVVSATTAFVPAIKEQERYLYSAANLVKSARELLAIGETEDAFETAYQAALRTAGARLAVAEAHRRRRPTGGAWERLSRIDAAGKLQAETFTKYSPLRNDLNSGLTRMVSPSMVDALLRDVDGFLSYSEEEAGWLPQAA